MVFCNILVSKDNLTKVRVTILILIDGFLQFHALFVCVTEKAVTILILIDGFLQSLVDEMHEYTRELSQSLF